MNRILAVSLVSILVCVSFLISSCSSDSKSALPQRGDRGGGGGMSVNGIILKVRELENVVRASGTVLASESVDLVTEASGRVERITLREGASVKKGDLLMKLVDDDLQAQLRKTELQLALASEQEQRQQHLFNIAAISKEQYDIALTSVNTLKADRENLIASIRKREIRAPFAGVVGLRYVSEGAYVAPTSRIASMQNVNPVKVDFAIPEKYASQVRPGDLVECANNEARLQFSGKVYAVEPKIDPALGTIQVRALCENKTGAIVPGASVQVSLRLRKIADALLVPSQAVIPVLRGQTVFVRRNGVALAVPVTTGLRTASEVQVTSGLTAGDTVLTTGIMQLRNGAPVQVALP